jgi:hypothetical protein
MYWEIITDFKILVYDGMLNVLIMCMFCTRTDMALSNWGSSVILTQHTLIVFVWFLYHVDCVAAVGVHFITPQTCNTQFLGLPAYSYCWAPYHFPMSLVVWGDQVWILGGGAYFTDVLLICCGDRCSVCGAALCLRMMNLFIGLFSQSAPCCIWNFERYHPCIYIHMIKSFDTVCNHIVFLYKKMIHSMLVN